jgi:endogenous inhibitor of DNA gyrase (YacG/DUF329 family)
MVETVVFQGVRFRRYPEAKGRAERVYYSPGIADRQRGVGRLHEEIWKAIHGPIPEGSHIHHGDHNPLNNAPENLECLTAEQHRRHHGKDVERFCVDEWLHHLDAIRPAAAAWHRTEEGRAWHAEHARNQWAERESAERRCDHCGTPYGTKSRKGDERFCTVKCRTAARRVSGVDLVERCCAWCDKPFTTNKNKKARFCSKACGARNHRWSCAAAQMGESA